jgi:hypothetical protein
VATGKLERGGVVTPLNPLVAFRSPRALDIDVDKLTDPTIADVTAHPVAEEADCEDVQRLPRVIAPAAVPPIASTPSVAVQMTPATRPPAWAGVTEVAHMGAQTPQPRRASHPHGDHKRGEVPLQTLEEISRWQAV